MYIIRVLTPGSASCWTFLKVFQHQISSDTQILQAQLLEIMTIPCAL